jgi:hypothetical protein
MIPLICESGLTKPSRWYVVTRYTLRPKTKGGNLSIVAHRKYDVTYQMEEIFARFAKANKRGYIELKMLHGSTAKRLEEKCPILTAEFWQKGIFIEGKVIRPFHTANGMCYEIHTDETQEIDGEVCFPKEPGKIKTNRVAIGSLKGFQMALAQGGFDPLIAGDLVRITSVGTVPTENDSPMVLFEVDLTPRGHR